MGHINNPKFDPMHAMPNPANIINPNSKGDEGAGDPKHFANQKLPGIIFQKFFTENKIFYIYNSMC